ncbi:MFS transporter [Devosia sp. Root635]|uniref:MFS transporter n=1 Tax=Devosia sp. Root635 TaxID=1736575 RepID=UPI00138F022F|nr:MFS transporter [Devosia sp. Root635]
MRLPAPDLAASAFVLHVLLHQVVIIVARVTTSYRAVEMGLSDIWIGAVGATFSLLPLFLATQVGARIDEKGARGAFLVGTGGVLVSALGLLTTGNSVIALLGWTGLLGTGHLLCLLSQHATAADQATDAARGRMFAYYTALISFAQILAPLVVAVFAGSGALPDTGRLFAAAAVAGLISLGCVLFMRHPGKPARDGKSAAQLPIRQLLRQKGVVPAILAGVGVICAIDLLVIYLPVLGAQALIPASAIAALLMVRALASLLSRLCFGWLLSRLGRRVMLTGSLLATGLGLTVLGIPVPGWALALAMILIGIGIGMATPISMSWVTSAVPPTSRGLVLSLRLTGNRLAQFLLPMSVGVVATGAGVSSVFLLLAAGLYGSAYSSYRALRPSAGSDAAG